MENESNALEVEVEFKTEGIRGNVPTGTYLIDAAKRLGVRFPIPCISVSGEHYCSVDVESGIGALSDPSDIEKEFYERGTAVFGNRLACQARLEKSATIVVETRFVEVAGEPKPEPETELFENYKERFSALPLDQKMSEISQLEAIALADTFGFVMNAPYAVGNKVTDILAGIGMKKDVGENTKASDENDAAETRSGDGTEATSGQ
ncbi:MAG: 2Fe-2S iron-sulfur cluster binding domain-containing protein [Acidobacteria bacterium]|nr:2Fe-2S iron-sulfur cluster binding domain-containing protein [Acidobacteriota bacterium]